jgi:hypothetical protein
MGVKEKRHRYKEEFRREILNSARDLFIVLVMKNSPYEFMKRESMARNSYFEFREIVQACIRAGKLRRMDSTY